MTQGGRKLNGLERLSMAAGKMFTPITIGGVKINSCIAMAPMAAIEFITDDGRFLPRAVDY